MIKQVRAKQERIIESVRRGLEGDLAVEFIHRSGFAMTLPGIEHHLRSTGGREKILHLIEEGMSNIDILRERFPDEDLSYLPAEEPVQGELFVANGADAQSMSTAQPARGFETTKFTVKLPTDLYEAISLAAKAEGKKRNDLIVDILTHALARMPDPPSGDI